MQGQLERAITGNNALFLSQTPAGAVILQANSQESISDSKCFQYLLLNNQGCSVHTLILDKGINESISQAHG